MKASIYIADTINTADVITAISKPEYGAVDVFIGTVRNHTEDKKVIKLYFECYKPMALLEMQKIADEAKNRFAIQEIIIHHATGEKYPGELAVVIAVAAHRRKAAFEACEFAIDTLKQTVPIWKKEFFEDGSVWVAAHP